MPIALGSDIGGSIRIPAHFNGIVGFKPTQNRLTYIGGNSARITGFDQGMGHFQATGGPLAHSVRDCIEFFKVQSIENAHLTDPFRAPITFDQKKIDDINADHSKVKVGFLKETEFLPVSDTVKRAMDITRQALKEDGYEVVDFEISREHYSFARNTLIAMVINGTVWELAKDLYRNGERETFAVWINVFFLNRSSYIQRLLRGIMRAVGIGR